MVFCPVMLIKPRQRSLIKPYHALQHKTYTRSRSFCSTSTKHEINVVMIACVWPEKRSSAAGVRCWNLMDMMREVGWKVTFMSPAKENEYVSEILSQNNNWNGDLNNAYDSRLQVNALRCQVNDSQFDAIIKQINPHIVLFDRYIIEEQVFPHFNWLIMMQFGWRVREHCKNTALIIDTQDLHCLRLHRQQLLKQGKELNEIVDSIPDMSPELLRELSSIHRSDHTFLVSPYELELLTQQYSIPSDKLSIASFFYPDRPSTPLPSFQQRKNFVMIGNFRHPPNHDQLQWVAKSIWPQIRNKLGDVQLHVYGAYPDHISQQLTSKSQGIFIKGNTVKHSFLFEGYVQDQFETLSGYRVNLAPLRFGAGIKGKIADGFHVGTPCVTTRIGSEGMTLSNNQFGGFIAGSVDEIVNRAAQLYTEEATWYQSQQMGFQIMDQLFSYSKNSKEVIGKMTQVYQNLASLRRRNYVGEMLWYHSNRSTEYMSRYIELKSKLKNTG